MGTSATTTTLPTVSVEQFLRSPGAIAIDVRSPSEFAEDHLPGAASAPLLDDDERALVGTLYRRASPEEAFERARELTRHRIGAIVGLAERLGDWTAPPLDLERRLLERTQGGVRALERELAPEAAADIGERPIVCYCWRGGLRSRSVVSLLRELGCERAFALAGGYRAWRAHVNAALAATELPPAYVLRGLTGVGKTLVLRELARLRPDWALDLEALAGHRSSILGAVGLAPVSQKCFDGRLLARVERGLGGLVVVEGESRKVGDVVLPPFVWRAIDGGVAIELRASTERRIDVLIDDYLEHASSRADLATKLPFIEERLGQRWKGELVLRLADGRERELVGILLERYYDPLYRHSEKGRTYAHAVDAADPARAAAEIAEWIDAHAARSAARTD